MVDIHSATAEIRRGRKKYRRRRRRKKERKKPQGKNIMSASAHAAIITNICSQHL